MAENNTEEIPAADCLVAAEDPPVFAAAEGSENPNKDPDPTHRSKRRKSCPTSLDKFESIKQPNFSFTFDTNFAGTPDSTPRFGSFNSPELGQLRQIPGTSKRKSGTEEDKYGVGEESEVESALSSVDGIESSVESVREKGKKGEIGISVALFDEL
ncbi:hypothetical protein U1Q18_013841 [Sarracenia purpurea var. burkii]